MRTATVPSFAKINLDLRVLHKRSDGFHELRTIFQTVSIKDQLTIRAGRARQTSIELASNLPITLDPADNLVVRAARLVLDRLRTQANIQFHLEKRIPMGAGMGGGSSNAAAVLRALPALLEKTLSPTDALDIAASLGSDVPFFLLGGTSVAIGRGTELYPLPDLPAHPIVVVSTGIHVSTADAYRALQRGVTDALTSLPQSPILREFQTVAGALENSGFEQLRLKNDFEPAVFAQHPELVPVVRKLRRLGARPALMTGSGSAIFGVFASAAEARAAARQFPKGQAAAAQLLSRKRYEQAWRQALAPAKANKVLKSG